MSQMNKIRTYQFVIMMGALFGYLFVYRRFFSPKSVLNSTAYHQAVSYVKNSEKIQKVLGKQLQVMNCNGKMYPLKNDINFDLLIYGTEQKGKVRVKSEFNKAE